MNSVIGEYYSIKDKYGNYAKGVESDEDKRQYISFRSFICTPTRTLFSDLKEAEKKLDQLNNDYPNLSDKMRFKIVNLTKEDVRREEVRNILNIRTSNLIEYNNDMENFTKRNIVRREIAVAS